MRRIALGSLVVMMSFGATARSQWIGAGSTPQGDYLRGVGIAAWGMGSYNLNTAQGYAITVDANIKSDTYISQVLRADRDNFAKLDRQRQARYKANYEAIKERIRNHPETFDVFKGNALNSIMDELNSPSIQDSSLRSAPVEIPREMIRRIPFKLDQHGLIFSLQRLTARGKGKWPVELQQDQYAGLRKNWERAIDQAMDQMIDGKMLTETIDNYRNSVSDLTNMLEREAQRTGMLTTDKRYREAKTRLHELEKATELMKTRKSQAIMAGIDGYKGKTVNDLRKFMHEHNLRFADANVDSEDERNLYVDLFASLDEVKRIVIGNDKGQDK